MNQLKLRNYYIESFTGEFPSFPHQFKEQGVMVKEELSGSVILYLSKKNKSDFVVKLKIKYLGINKKTGKSHFRFNVMIVGLFRALEENQSIRLIAKTIAKEMLYEKVNILFSNIFSHVPLENFKITLQLKKSR